MTNLTTTPVQYIAGEIIHTGARTVVRRGTLATDGRSIIIKTFALEHPPARDLAKLRQEFEFAREISAEVAVQPIELIDGLDGKPALILEDFGGQSLKQLLGSKRITTQSFMKIAPILASHLACVHAAGIIHKDIKPQNILVNPKTNALRLIDFGISSRIETKNQHLGNPDGLEGTLAYISPEQTGRMNRIVDSRSDLYSLGVTFYEMLTGRLPFDAKDSMELVHAHIAREATPVHEVNPKVPLAISAIIARLMAKNAELRYQSARGLEYDLNECARRMQDGTIDLPFVPGQRDDSGVFQISQKLYGRENELNDLMSAFQRVADGGSEIVLVAGFSGVGKSALINEIHKPVTATRGLFISGKYDQFQRNIPYYAIRLAFEDLSEILLSENEQTLAIWRERIRGGVGDTGQVLIEVMPGLERVIGKQPAVPELGPQESQNRFNLVFRNFIQAITSNEHPLVLFIDDLQWADAASLALIKSFMSDPESSHLLLIGAYRDNEVDDAHPFALTISDLKKNEHPSISTVRLGNLTRTDVRNMLADALLNDGPASEELSGLIYEKTQGNAFFTKELLEDLSETRQLKYSPDSGWTWNVEHIRALSITDNVVELMAQKMHRFSDETRQVLRLAACIGNKFDLNTLSIIHEKNPTKTLAALWPAVSESTILPTDENYRSVQAAPSAQIDSGAANARFSFAHDRIQQAAYGLIVEDERAAIHLRIGRLLLASTPEDQLEEQIFRIVNQLNEGRALLNDPTEIHNLARYNWQAGARAIKSSAFLSAANYLTVAVELVETIDGWRTHRDLTWNIFADRALARRNASQLEGSEADVVEALAHCVSDEEMVRLYQTYLMTLFQMNRHGDSMQAARTALKQLGVRLPRKITKLHVGLQYVLFRLRLGFRKSTALLDLPAVQNERILHISRVIYDAVPSAYIAAPDTMAYITLYMARLGLKYGHSNLSAFAYAMTAVAQVGVTKEFRLANDFINLALKLNEMYPDLDVKGRAHFINGGFTMHWRQPVQGYRENMDIARRCFFDTGNMNWRNYATAFARTQSLLYTDQPLLEIEAENLKLQESHIQSPDREVILNQYFLLGFIRRLRGESMENLPTSFPFDADQYDAEMRTPGNYVVRMYYFTFRMIESYLANDFSTALGFARNSSAIVLEVFGVLLDQIGRLFFILTHVAARTRMTWWQRLRLWLPYRLHLFLLRHAARNAPQNFQGQYLLARAEHLRGKRRFAQAAILFEQAIQATDAAGFPFFRALAFDLTAGFYFSQDQARIALMHLNEARKIYSRWGAVARVRALTQQYSELTRHETPTDSHETATSTIAGTTTGTTALDMETVLKATQTISGEFLLDRLLAKLLNNLIQNAGAERVCLFLERGGSLFLEAEVSTRASEPVLLQSKPLDPLTVASTMVQLVFRTGRSLVLGNAAATGRFAQDPYIHARKPKSVLCQPLAAQGRNLGVLYLENNLTTDAFTPGRVELLNILASQAAISIENSRLVVEETERQKLHKEMEMAKSVQTSILPQFSDDPEYNICAHMSPAAQVGGDYYDYYCRDNNRWLAIGDVTGHGLNSGLLMMMAQTGFSTYLNTTNQPDVVELFLAVNRTLYENMANRTKQNLYMTLTALRADGEGNIEHAGKHEDILVWRKNTGRVEVIQTDGVWMGIVPDVTGMIPKSHFRLEPGDFITLFTDGVIECRNADREQFEPRRLIHVIQATAPAGIAAVRDAIVAACFDFMDHQDDDVTLMLIEKK